MRVCTHCVCMCAVVYVFGGGRVRWWAEDVAVDVAVTVFVRCIRVCACDGGGEGSGGV